MTPDQIAAYIAIGLSTVTLVYTFYTSSPKEIQKEINKVVVDHAETKRDLANLIKTVDRLAELVYAEKKNHGRTVR